MEEAEQLAAVEDAKQLAMDWESLEGLLDTERFYGVKARFAQQVTRYMGEYKGF